MLEHLRQHQARTKSIGCTVCGERTAATIGVAADELIKGTHHGGGRGSRIASRTVSLCEKHTEETYLLFAAFMEQIRKGIPPEEL